MEMCKSDALLLEEALERGDQEEESENLKRINRALIDTADFVADHARRGNFNDLLKEEMQKFGISESGSMTEQQEKKVVLIIYMAFAREAARAAGLGMNVDVTQGRTGSSDK